MKAIRLTDSEASAVLAWADGELGHTQCHDVPAKVARSIVKKVLAAREPSTNVAVAPIENALLAAARGKVVALVEGHGQASVRAGKLGVTPEKAQSVGEYLARTRWLTGPFTLLDILNKWPQYLSKAAGTAPPPSVPAGLGGAREERAEGPARQGPGYQERRPAPGFGGGRKDPYPDRDPSSR